MHKLYFGLAVFISLLSLPAAFGSMSDARQLRFYHTHTLQELEITYYRDGAYQPDALGRLEHFLSDWRNGKAREIDPELMDILWDIQQLSGHEGGTTFSIYLPAAASDPSWTPCQDLSRVPEGTGQLILIAEDDIATREALRQCELHGAHISLVLSDLVMPEMDGNALFAELEAHYPQIKVIAMTGHPLDENPETQPPGVVDWLQKPIGLDDLS